MMENRSLEVSERGRRREVPSLEINGKSMVVRGSSIKVAQFHDEYFQEGDLVGDWDGVVGQLRAWKEKPDVLKYSGKVFAEDRGCHLGHQREAGNFAIIEVSSFEHWLRKQARKDVKEGVRRANRDGVVVRPCEFDEAFVAGVKEIYDETPIRQGRKYWHYQKSITDIKQENGTYSDRAEFLGAFLEDEMIGFVKMVYVGEMAKTMQVICKEKYFRWRPTTALIAKAVEVCADKGVKYFNYGCYEYPGKKDSTLTEFKFRHGFQRVDFPVYYVPLTVKGRIYTTCRMYRGWKGFVPARLLSLARRIRGVVKGGRPIGRSADKAGVVKSSA